MDLSDVTRKTEDGLEVEIYVSPRSSKQGLDGIDEWRNRIIVRVRAPPLDGRANKEVEKLMRELTGMKSTVIKGMTDRRKTVSIQGDYEIIAKKLEDAL